MSSPKNNNVLIMQSGGCTAVMNRSLVGLVEALFASPAIDEVHGASHGLAGILEERLYDLRRQSARTWTRVVNTPGAVLGSGRRSLRSEDVPRVLATLARHSIGYFFTIGGNDSSETAHAIARADDGIVVVHVPKTIDNDLVGTDHTPGYGSAARFVALATMGAGRDAEAMGHASPLTIIEVMGRDAGWLAAASGLAKGEDMDAPHFISIPEVPLDEARFLATMDDALSRWGFAVAVTAENTQGVSGLVGGEQEPFFVDDFGHKYFEGPGRHLAHLASREFKVRARFEKPGTIQRSIMACVSRTDADEAVLVGRAAAGYALEGHSDCMVTLVRQPGAKYRCTTGLADLEEIAEKVRPMPPGYFDASAGQATSAFVEYATPLVGARLPRYGRLTGLQSRRDS